MGPSDVALRWAGIKVVCGGTAIAAARGKGDESNESSKENPETLYDQAKNEHMLCYWIRGQVGILLKHRLTENTNSKKEIHFTVAWARRVRRRRRVSPRNSNQRISASGSMLWLRNSRRNSMVLTCSHRYHQRRTVPSALCHFLGFLGEISYKICCGKSICRGCEEESIAVSKKENAQNDRECISCPFCRVPAPTSENIARIMEERILTNNSEALCIMGGYMLKGGNGFPKDELRAFDCLIRSIELGSAESCGKLAAWFREGTGAPKDMKRANLFMKIGALRGDIYCRHNIGVREYNAGNHEVGIRHFKLAAEAGYQVSLNGLRDVYNADGKMPGKEFISKKCLDELYRLCHAAQEEVKSEARENFSAESSSSSYM